MPDFGIGEALAAFAAFGGEAAVESGAALGAEALAGGAEAGASAFGIGEAAAGGLGATEAASGGLGIAEAAGALGGGSGAADAATAAASLGGGAGGVAPATATGFDVASGASTGLDALSKTASGFEPAAAGGDQSIFGKLVSGVTNNPLQAAGVGVAGAGLGYNILQGSKNSAERSALGASAGALGAQGQQLMQYLQSGTLPPGLQMQVTKANEAAKARIIQNHAQNGMPTDPSQNSALAQELNSVDAKSMEQIATIGQQLLTTGINETGLSDQLYAQLIGIDKAQAQSTGLAISNFAAALGGRPPQQQKAA